MILCIGTTPAAQRVMLFKSLELDQVNRAVVTLDGIAGKSINVAKALKHLGAEPFATGFLGGARGKEIQQVLAERRIDFEFISVSVPTRQCITVIDQSSGVITELVEESRPVTAIDYENLLVLISKRINDGRCQAAVMSGTAAPGGPPDVYAQVVRMARTKNILSVVDASGTSLLNALKECPSLIKPNRKELERTVERPLSTDAAVFAAMAELSEGRAENVVVTDGKESVFAFAGTTRAKIIPPKIKPLNPIGSGDSFTAGLTLALLRQPDLQQACVYGAATGAANALSWMPGELERADVERLVIETRIVA